MISWSPELHPALCDYVTVILYFKKRKGEGERKRKDEVLIIRTDGRTDRGVPGGPRKNKNPLPKH